MTDIRPLWIAGEPETGTDHLTVHHPYDGQPVAAAYVPTEDQVLRAVDAADRARPEAAALPAHARAEILDTVSRRITDNAPDIAGLITMESGKPIRWALAEAARAASVFRWAAEEIRRFSGDLQRLDTDPASEGRLALVQRFPHGPVLAITPFNFPLNLVAHKVAPAIAVGAPVIVKPAPKTPLSALWLAGQLADAGLPPGMLSVLPLPNERAAELVTDPRLPVVSFTGSGPVGWAIRDTVPRKHVILELGGNAAAIVCADWNTGTDLEWAADRIATFATYQAGQSCISVQRVYADRAVHTDLLERIVAAVNALTTGDPWDEATDVGPMIDAAAARRVADWVGQALQAGAVVRTGGTHEGTTYAPTVLTDVPADAAVSREEVFAPILTMTPVDDLTDAVAAVNNSRYGLQTGVFTHDLSIAFRAYRELQVGGVVIGDVPSYRADHMPYGGTKDSGIGREGVRYAMTDYTYERTLVLTET